MNDKFIDDGSEISNEGSDGGATERSIEISTAFKPEKTRGYFEFKEFLDRNDLSSKMSSKLGLDWQKKVLVEDTDKDADYRYPDTVLVDYDYGKWASSGTAHEMVHLLLYQNGWSDDTEISSFIHSQPELTEEVRSPGYPIEQMIAYLAQRDVLIEIAGGDDSLDENGLKRLYGKEWMDKILEREYSTKFLSEMANLMISKWDERGEDESVLDWLKGVLKSVG